MTSIKSYKELIVWQKGMLLAEEVYRLLKSFPEDEKFGLISQMKRSVVSTPSNIVEGWGRSTKSFQQFLKISIGSLYELETQLILSKKLKIL